MPKPPKPGDSFETIYPRYPFAELVRLSLVIARWLARARAQAGKAAKGVHESRRAKSIRVI